MKRSSLTLKTHNIGFESLDKKLLLAVLALVVFGFVMVANASIVDAAKTFGDRFFYAKRHLFWIFIGLSSMAFFYSVPYQLLKKISFPLFIFTMFLLLVVLIPGIGLEINGARRWIGAGFFVIQPSEIAKLGLVLYLASFFSSKKSLPTFLFVILLSVGLVMMQPDLGTAIIILSIAIIIYFVSGAPIWYFLSMFPVLGIVGSLFVLTSSYRKERLLTFFNPNADPLGTSYHIRQVLIALGSGGIFGVGIGQSRQKYLFLPEPATDSIFAVIGEELGLVGTVAVVVVFTFIVWKGLTISLKIADPFGKLLAVGITSLIGIQAFLNLSAMVALVPLTGVPLPFLSYGGSSLIVMLSAVGILLKLSKYKEAAR